MKNNISITPFNWAQSWDSVYQALMKDVWKVGYENQVMYDMSPVYLDWSFNQRTDILFAAYNHPQLVGFIGGSRRQVRCGTHQLEIYLAHLFAVARHYQHGIIGYRLLIGFIQDVLKQNPAAIILGYLDQGHETERLFNRFLKVSGYGGCCLTNMNFYTKILNLQEVDAAEPLSGLERLGLIPPFRDWLEHIPTPPKCNCTIRPYHASDLESCLKLLNQYQYKTSLKMTRIWTKDELARKLQFKNLSQTWVCESRGEVIGLINYYFMTLRGKINIRVAVMDEVYLEGLGKQAQKQLLAKVLHHVKSKNITAFITANMAYYPRQAFRWARFIPYPRTIRLVAIGQQEHLDKLPAIKSHQLYLEHR